MDRDPVVEGVFVAPEPEAPMREESAVEAVAGRGLRGDRYFAGEGTVDSPGEAGERPNGSDLTLIEREAVEAVEREAGIELAPGGHRRNVETRGVTLDDLVGRRFRVGDAVCRGDGPCEPCAHLERLTEEGVLDALVHRGGLRADVLRGGTIAAGDPIEPLE